MIKVNDRWSFERDKWCWVLYENAKGVKKRTQEEIDVVNETYHSNLEQVCRYILDKTAGDAKDVNALMVLFANTWNRLARALKGQGAVAHA